MKRQEVEEKYKWHLEDMFVSNEAWEEDFVTATNTYLQIESFKGKLGDSKKLLECLRLSDSLEMLVSKLYVYARMRRDEDGRNDLYAGMVARISTVLNNFSAAASFISSEISALPNDYLNNAINNPEFADYDFMLKEIVRKKEHILSEKEEKILSLSASALSGYQEAFMAMDNIDLPLPTLKIGGKKVKLTHGNYSYYLNQGDAKTRKAVFNGMYGAFKQVINTVAVLYSGSVKKDNFYSKARGNKSALEGTLFSRGIPMEVYKNLLKTVKANLKNMHEYVALRKSALGLKKMHMYDMYTPIVSEVNMSMDYEQAYNLVVEGLAPMGADYHDLLITARDKGWIDVMENEGKRSGAYSWGCFQVHPYVLLNYSRTTHDIFTIAHELGHAMHSFYSKKCQPYAKHGYQIFVAEVASTVNEMLLIKHLLATTTDKKTRCFLLNYCLDMFRGTLFRQTMFAEFEMIAHEMEQNGEALTVQSMSDKYYALNKKYYGRAVHHDEDIKYEWARIPHFYTSFYVYQYSTGIISAVNIANKILKDNSFAEVYREKFLSAGGSASPYEILKSTGVDLATDEPFKVAMDEFSSMLAELKRELEA